MFTYSQSTGALRDAQGLVLGMAYAGHAAGLNNPAMQEVPDVGPIPQGMWTVGQPDDAPHLGPFMTLTPSPDTDTFGRSGLLIHGDLIGHVGDHLASCGCIVVTPALFEVLASSADREIQVTP